MKGARRSGRKSKKSNNNDNNIVVAVESEEMPALEEEPLPLDPEPVPEEIAVAASAPIPVAQVFFRSGLPLPLKEFKDDEHKYAFLVHFDDGSMGKLLCTHCTVVQRGEKLAQLRSSSSVDKKKICFSRAERISE